MKNQTLLILGVIAAAVGYYFLKNRKTDYEKNVEQTGKTGVSTETMRPANPYWTGWDTFTDASLKNLTDSVSETVADTNRLYTNVRENFPFLSGIGWTRGPANRPSTNGSGAGVPQ